MKLFLADDSKHFRERMRKLIEEISDIEIVGEAGDGTMVLAAVQELNPDVVLLDIQMPGENGIQVLEKIKNGLSSPIVIMVTNYPYEQYRKKCYELGADYFIDKSSEIGTVMDILKDLNKAMLCNSSEGSTVSENILR